MNEAVGDIPVAEPELAQFIRSLVTDGRAIVFAQPLDLANVAALPLLRAVDEGVRTEAGIEAPAFSESAALWGAQMLYQLCQFTVCRNIGARAILPGGVRLVPCSQHQ